MAKPSIRKQLGPDAAAVAIAIRRAQKTHGITETDLLPAIIRAAAHIADQHLQT